MSYPEHEKLKKIQKESQTCGEFIDWLNEQGIKLARYVPRFAKICGAKREKAQNCDFYHYVGWCDEYNSECPDILPIEEDDQVPEDFVPLQTNTEKLLAQFFNIDLDKLEQEKLQMLNEIRNKNKEAPIV